MQTEDAETQMDQLTPVMETIKKEAGAAVLAHMEERSTTFCLIASDSSLNYCPFFLFFQFDVIVVVVVVVVPI